MPPRNVWEQCSLVRAVGYLGMTGVPCWHSYVGMKTVVSLMCSCLVFKNKTIATMKEEGL